MLLALLEDFIDVVDFDAHIFSIFLNGFVKIVHGNQILNALSFTLRFEENDLTQR
jgi:hypothetical protein